MICLCWPLPDCRFLQINPCNSNLHPAVKEAGLKVDADAEEICVQEAYTPESKCESESGLFMCVIWRI